MAGAKRQGEPASGRRTELAHDARLWSRGRILVGVAIWIVGLVTLALLSVAAHTRPTFPGDVRIAELVQGLRGTLLAPVINFASDANWPTPAGITAVAVIVALLLVRRVRAAICAAMGGFGADLANVTLNGWVARPRPNNVQIHVVAHLGLHSFPSGHVTHVIGFYGFLLYLTYRIGWARSWPAPLLWAIRVICLYFIVFIGPSRVLEGEHWPSDVVASYLLGALVLAVAIALYHLLARLWLDHVQRREHVSQAGTRATPAAPAV